MKLKDDKIQSMASNEDWLLGFYYGLAISANKNKKSIACAHPDDFVLPKNTGNLIKSADGWLFFAGGDDEYFSCVDIEVWGLN